MKKSILPVVFCFGLVTSSSLVLANNTNFSLETMISQGLANNLELRQAQLDLEVSRKINQQNQRFASLIGNANLDYLQADQIFTKNSDFGVTIISGDTLDPAIANWSLSLNHLEDELAENISDTYSLKYAPFKFDQKINTLETKLNLANAQNFYQITRINTITKIRTLYAESYQRSILLKLANEHLQLTKDSLKQSNSLFKAGKISRLELQTTEQEEKAATNQLEIAELNYEAALSRLGVAIGEPHLTLDQPLNLEPTLNWGNSSQINLNSTLAKIRENSPELKIVQIELQLAKLRLQQASLCQLSGLELGVSHNVPKATNDTNEKTTTYSLGISGSLDDLIFKNISHQKKTFASSNNKLELILKTGEAKLLESFQAWKIAELSLKPLQEAWDLAKERLRVISLKFEKGMSDNSEVIEARQALAEAEANYWQTWLELIQARENFYELSWGNPVLK